MTLSCKTFASAGLRLVQDRPQVGTSCPLAESENEIHDEKRCEPARLEARRSLAKSGCRDADRLEMGCDGASAQGNSKRTQKTGNQGDDCDRARAQISLVEEEERRAALRASRVELALSTNLEQDQGEYRDGKLPRKHKASISTGVRLRNKKIPKQFSQTSSETSIQSRRTKKLSPNPRDFTGKSCGKT